jgi:tetratricopeptide (TPR) repeat protein
MAQLNTDRILEIGQNALYFEDYVLSIQYFNQVIKIKPYLAEPYVFRAIAKIELGDYRGADEDCSQAIERNPFMTQAYYARGFARRSLEYYPEAISDFTKALEFSPNNLNLLMNRIDTQERNKDYKGAMTDIDMYLKLNPKTTGILYEKGRIQMELKDTAGAEITLNKYVEVDSTNFLSWSARGLLRMQKNNIDGALHDYNKAISLKSTYFGDFINRGILNVQKKNYKQALIDYNTAIKMDSKSSLAYYNRGLLRANLGDNNNALTDLTKVLQLDTANTEALLRKAMLEATIGDFKTAIKDYKTIIQKHPYFLPAYLGIAEAENALGNIKNAFKYRQMADNMEKNKDYIARKEKENIKAENKIVASSQENISHKNTNLFNRFMDQDNSQTKSDSKYNNEMRGQVQDNYTDVVNERNFVLSYYAKSDEIRHTNVYYPAIEQYNNRNRQNSPLKITNNESPLTAELITSHFDRINEISARMTNKNPDADIYFNRALEFSMVQDYNSAIDDLNKAIEMNPDFMIAYFCRANIRYKLVDYTKNNQKSAANIESATDKKDKVVQDKQFIFDVDLVMHDFDKVETLASDFSFAYYNKANILCTQKDFQTAIQNYTKAIEIDPDFAEAYFNRGLTYLFIGQDAKGLTDLSKAGELGIYKAYNLIQRFKK